MSGTPIAMNKLRKVIALYSAGKSKSYISSCLHLSRNTVKKYIIIKRTTKKIKFKKLTNQYRMF